MNDKDEGFDYWSERDLLLVQRRCLLDGKPETFGRSPARNAQTASSSSEPPPASPPGGPLPPPPGLLYSFDTVYRFTRGVNDLANTGLGYGELAREARLMPGGKELGVEKLWLRRTRTGWQRLQLGNRPIVKVPPPSDGASGPGPVQIASMPGDSQ